MLIKESNQYVQQIKKHSNVIHPFQYTQYIIKNYVSTLYEMQISTKGLLVFWTILTVTNIGDEDKKSSHIISLHSRHDALLVGSEKYIAFNFKY